MAETPYARLEKLFRRLSALADAEAVLNWDQAAMMPRGGAGARAGQVAELRAVRHSMISAPETGEWLDAAEAPKRCEITPSGPTSTNTGVGVTP